MSLVTRFELLDQRVTPSAVRVLQSRVRYSANSPRRRRRACACSALIARALDDGCTHPYSFR